MKLVKLRTFLVILKAIKNHFANQTDNTVQGIANNTADISTVHAHRTGAAGLEEGISLVGCGLLPGSQWVAHSQLSQSALEGQAHYRKTITSNCC